MISKLVMGVLITLSWKAPECQGPCDISGYVVEWKTVSGEFADRDVTGESQIFNSLATTQTIDIDDSEELYLVVRTFRNSPQGLRVSTPTEELTVSVAPQQAADISCTVDPQGDIERLTTEVNLLRNALGDEQQRARELEEQITTVLMEVDRQEERAERWKTAYQSRIPAWRNLYISWRELARECFANN